MKFTAFSIFFFPSSMVLKPMGAAGTVPLLLAMLVFAFWLGSVLFGLEDPTHRSNPGRLALAALWLATTASYVALNAGLTGGSSMPARAAADRVLILLLASAGLILVISEVVRSAEDALVLVRWLLAGAFFCCLVALVQFVFRVNPMEWIRALLPGFTYNGGDTPFQTRAALVRVAGSTFHSIELAVVSSMLLPLSIWRAVYDPLGRKWFHWLQCSLLVIAIASTVSRSGVIGLVTGLFTFVPFLPKGARKWTVIVAPITMASLFLIIPGLMSTLASSFTIGSADPSISTRTNNYPRVEALFNERPILGLGPGNYIFETALQILDNQYLTALVTLGGVGLVGTAVYFVLPAISALMAAKAIKVQKTKSLAGAVAGGGLVAAVCSFTFDSLSFPVFALTYPILIGLSGTVWCLARDEKRSSRRS
ncbi:O-antigen ligase [Pseudarthrobacter sp. NIBRBAC000502771]|uniref:O-antigen ligase family protein n=1 Tax=Pseudarthrobacter sp. NIBRBAC000502771 TaxID=2590774 RepID=UPI001FEEF1E8|nr:O-antigen ligase family protein [Pseudarthrobacter sp. NIBRBAC000502771]